MKPLQLLTLLLQFSLVSQREREAMKAQRTHYGAADKSWLASYTVSICLAAGP